MLTSPREHYLECRVWGYLVVGRAHQFLDYKKRAMKLFELVEEADVVLL